MMFIGLQIMMDIVRQIGKVFNPLMPVVTKTSHILKQTCSSNLQLSAAGLFKYVWPFMLPPGIKGF